MLFIDSTALVGAADRGDERHADGRALLTALASGALGQALVSDFVLDEVVTILGRRTGVGPARAVAFARGLLASPRVRMLYVEEDVVDQTLESYRRFGPALSFTDLTSVALMRRAGCTMLYSHDSGFDRVPTIQRRTTPPS